MNTQDQANSRNRRLHLSLFHTQAFAGQYALEARTLLSVVDVLSYRDAQPNTPSQPNTGLNTQESLLQPSNVSSSTFGKQFETQVDGQVYAQPLVKTGVNITVGPEPGVHNVVLVATQHDSLYAIDATSGHVLWKDSFIDPAHGITTVTAADVGSDDITPEIGITSTPVIDPKTNILYLVAKSKVVRDVGADYLLTMHAINLADGTEALGGPAVIADTYWDGIDASHYDYVSGPSIPGTGDGAVDGVLNFNALRALQRCALTMYHDQVYVMTASHGDAPPYHGWILGYGTADLKLKTVFNTTPNGMDGGLWQSGAGIAIDPQGFMYVATGNGTFDTTMDANGFPGQGNYGNSLLKLAVDPIYTHSVNGWGLKVVDYFTPSNQAILNAGDDDFGSSGAMVLPDAAGSAAHPHLLTVMGKETRLFLIDRDNMGKFNPDGEQVVQIVTNNLNGAFASPAFAGSTMYITTHGDVNKAFTVSNGAIQLPAVTQSAFTFSYPGANPSLSFNGSSYGVEWLLDRGSKQLFAYDPTNLVNPLYSSSQAAGNRDNLSSVSKFDVPVVANGMVYVGTNNSIAGFGLFQNPPTSASFVEKNTSYQGSWNDGYGVEGFQISQDTSAGNPSIPYNVTVKVQQATPIVWNRSTTDPRALLKAAPGSTDGIAAAWSGNAFNIDVRMNDGLSHQVALYALDWDNKGRKQTIQVIEDATGAVLDTQTIADFQNGTYLVWNVKGNVSFRVTSNTPGTSAVIGGLFFGDRIPVPGTAAFVKKDTSTQGTWKPVYGADGYSLAQDPSSANPSVPAYARLEVKNPLKYSWPATGTDLQALQAADPNSTNRIAGIWYSDLPFTIDVKITDGKTHQVALYALDWDSNERAETIQLISTVTGQVLDTQSLDHFQIGVYTVWNISGDVTFKVTNTGPTNGVLSGIFFSTPLTITKQPSSSLVNPGATATFSATAVGNPAPTVQWQTSSNGGQTWSNIPKATGTTYTTGPLSASNTAPLFRAVFSSNGVSVTTRSVSVSLARAPIVTATPPTTIVRAGQTATFSATASGTPTPSVQWQLSTNNGQTWINIPGATSTTYSTSTTLASDGSRFRAVFSNNLGTATSSPATLTVYAAPVVTLQPAGLTLKKPGKATFTATAVGNPVPTVQWQVSSNGGRSWLNIAKATSTTYTTGTITLLKSSAQYRAVFSSNLGTVVTNAATASFIRPNRIKSRPRRA